MEPILKIPERAAALKSATIAKRIISRDFDEVAKAAIDEVINASYRNVCVVYDTEVLGRDDNTTLWYIADIYVIENETITEV